MEINNGRPSQKLDKNSQLKEENSQLKEENSQLKEENSQLKEKNSQLKEENSQLKEENSQLKEENSQLKEENTQLKKENSQLKKENSQLKQENSQLKQENSQLTEENQRRNKDMKWLFKRNLQLKNKNCHQDCVLCTIVWACGTKKLDRTGVCARALNNAILEHASKKREIKGNDLKCEQLMAILQEFGIVTSVGEFEYPSKSEARNNMINKAWDTLMNIDDNEGVVILGRRPVEADTPGHVEACELETRVDGKVKIYDPQQGEVSFQGNKEDFRDYVKDDRELLLFIVEWQKLADIIKKNEAQILQCMKKSNKKFLNVGAAGVIDG